MNKAFVRENDDADDDDDLEPEQLKVPGGKNYITRAGYQALRDELSHLHWVPLAEARALDLPFITEVVLAEVEALVRAAGNSPLHAPRTVPFFDNRGAEPRFVQLS